MNIEKEEKEDKKLSKSPTHLATVYGKKVPGSRSYWLPYGDGFLEFSV